MNSYILDWARSKINVAERLFKGECDGSYEEAVIIMSSIISGISSLLWPGKRIDKSRFIELLVQYSDLDLNIKRISIPLYYQFLKNENINLSDDFETIIKYNNQSLFGLKGESIDKDENEIIKLLPDFPKKNIREFSYANLIYEEIRCSFVHEYTSGRYASSHSSKSYSNSNVLVSYINVIDNNSLITKKIHFHFVYFQKLLNSILININGLLCNQIPLQIPKNWWIDEYKLRKTE